MNFYNLFYCPRCYTTLVFISEGMISCLMCRLSIKRIKDDEIEDHKRLLKNKFVNIAPISKKIKNIKNPSLTKT
ncbi:hypothetical protein LCGC14_0625660 [marine sediment metagenome]|uniref:Uncharacterized protein n=1 Tax=marine sediment metagenome TaxID=412755 RepID=A0A0F9TPW8_9ZZZZ